MGCDGCLISNAGIQVALQNTRALAKAHGEKEKIRHIAIWREGNEFFYAEAGSAFAAGKPVSEILSIDNDPTT